MRTLSNTGLHTASIAPPSQARPRKTHLVPRNPRDWRARSSPAERTACTSSLHNPSSIISWTAWRVNRRAPRPARSRTSWTVRLEGIPARIALPGPSKGAAAWALDERGQRKAGLPVQSDAQGRAVVAIGPRSRTLWHEVEVR